MKMVGEVGDLEHCPHGVLVGFLCTQCHGGPHVVAQPLHPPSGGSNVAPPPLPRYEYDLCEVDEAWMVAHLNARGALGWRMVAIRGTKGVVSVIMEREVR